MAVAAMMYYACGFAFAFGNGEIIGSPGFFLRGYGDPQEAFGIMGLSDALIESKWLFQFAFCAVTLAIVWGSTLERIKFGAYAIFAVVFAGFIYPLVSHWVFGGGWLQSNVGMQDFAGSTAVHLVGATAALAALLVLGPRRGKYNADGTPRPIPGPQHVRPRAGHVHPAVRLVRLQRGLHAGRDRRALRRGRDGHDARRLPAASSAPTRPPSRSSARSTSAWSATA